jgi:hypothetical protein
MIAQIKKKLVTTWMTVKQPFRYYLYTDAEIKPDPKDNVALVNFDEFLLDKDWGRYSFIICQMVKFSGFKIIIRLDYNFFFSLMPYKRMLLAQEYLKVRNIAVETSSIQLRGKNFKKKSIELVYGYKLFRNKIDAYYLPYTLHPRFYQTYDENTNFQAYRETERKIRILFAGNFERKAYSRPILKEDFEGIITRVEVLDHIRAKYSEDARIIYSPTKEHLYNLLETTPIVNNFIIIEVKTPQENWLRILSKGDFYLCLPGGAMPLSHNAFESMAVGTIPILQYNDLFYPHLEHLKNCIAYSSYDTLEKAIELALSMDKQDLLLMKQQVMQYYDEYLATEQTINRIKSFVESGEEKMTIEIPYLNKR